MAQDAITITGIEQYQEALRKMQTDNPATKKELQTIIRRAISEARKNIVKDAQDILENDPAMLTRRCGHRFISRYWVHRSIYCRHANVVPPPNTSVRENWMRIRTNAEATAVKGRCVPCNLTAMREQIVVSSFAS